MPIRRAASQLLRFAWLELLSCLNAWKYPGQLGVWEAVHTSKIGTWARLVTMSFVLVATVERYEGVFYQHTRPRSMK